MNVYSLTITSEYNIELRLNNKRELYFDHNLTARTKQKFVKMFIETMLVPLSFFLHTLGLDFGRIELVEYKSTESKPLHSESAAKIRKILEINNERNMTEDSDYISLKAKDAAYLSEKNYANFRRAIGKIRGVTVTSLYGLRKLQKVMNNFYKIAWNTMGRYVEPNEKLQFVLTKIYHKLNKNIVDDTFEILLCGDGLQLTRTLTITVTFTFNVINAKDTSPTGLYTLGNNFF